MCLGIDDELMHSFPVVLVRGCCVATSISHQCVGIRAVMATRTSHHRLGFPRDNTKNGPSSLLALECDFPTPKAYGQQTDG